jgi:hypothetical protein
MEKILFTNEKIEPFETTVEAVLNGEKAVRDALINDGDATLWDFFDKLNLDNFTLSFIRERLGCPLKDVHFTGLFMGDLGVVTMVPVVDAKGDKVVFFTFNFPLEVRTTLSI